MSVLSDDADVQRQKHIWLARLWLAFGLFGAAMYVREHGFSISLDVASSVPVLFFVSVYANYESHRAEAGTFRIEEKQEES